ncbi:hypothetical protein HDF22_004884 [Mucilaginibacter lappiensis]|uniref:Uncharacterized protein n=1 Tax=Mucilaginibacter lappiensis TaxID=354630 RepID=A0A841JHU9_9SPHI|nr:hypothetical protein [Mucilaginibacter lappiensis]
MRYLIKEQKAMKKKDKEAQALSGAGELISVKLLFSIYILLVITCFILLYTLSVIIRHRSPERGRIQSTYKFKPTNTARGVANH